jgi:opacity protein-like surface antigen
VKTLLIFGVLATLTLASIPAYAQRQAEIGIAAGWTGFSSDVADANAWRADFRAGYYLRDWVQLEGQAFGARAADEVGSVDIDTTLLAALVNGVFSYRKTHWAPYALVGVGGANLQISPGISSFSDFALAWQLGGGARFFTSKNMALRAEFSHLREKTFQSWNGHWSITGGVSWVFGEK